MTTKTNQASAVQSHAKADEARREAQDSFDRSDTDGWASQAASGLMARKHELQAKIFEQDGKWEFPALFDLEGNLVPAVRCASQWGGHSWRLLSTDEVDSEVLGWVNESKAASEKTYNANMAKKGYYVGRVMAPAYATLGGGGRGFAGMASVSVIALRSDRGFSRDVEVIDNGIG